MKEANFVRMLKKNFLGVCHRNHGGAYGTAGLPDLEGCYRPPHYRSRSVVIEAKIGYLGRNGQVRLKNKLTTIQNHWLSEYYNEGALSLLAVYLENEKKVIFFSPGNYIRLDAREEPWDLHIDKAETEIDFLKPGFVADKVWIGSTVNEI